MTLNKYETKMKQLEDLRLQAVSKNLPVMVRTITNLMYHLKAGYEISLKKGL
jgi:hypothetical protein